MYVCVCSSKTCQQQISQGTVQLHHQAISPSCSVCYIFQGLYAQDYTLTTLKSRRMLFGHVRDLSLEIYFLDSHTPKNV